MEEEMLELDLVEEEEKVQSRVLAIAVFYSRKSYIPRVLFANMIAAWGV
jgi:bacterioferritin (cytochrome b1)